MTTDPRVIFSEFPNPHEEDEGDMIIPDTPLAPLPNTTVLRNTLCVARVKAEMMLHLRLDKQSWSARDRDACEDSLLRQMRELVAVLGGNAQ